jgi:Ca2+/Na+ antiporter
MNKKANTWLFVLGATVYNLILMVGCIILMLVLYAKFLINVLPPASAQWCMLGIFVLGILAAFGLYKLTLNFLMKKFDFEKYFDPIFGNKPRRRRD